MRWIRCRWHRLWSGLSNWRKSLLITRAEYSQLEQEYSEKLAELDRAKTALDTRERALQARIVSFNQANSDVLGLESRANRDLEDAKAIRAKYLKLFDSLVQATAAPSGNRLTANVYIDASLAKSEKFDSFLQTMVTDKIVRKIIQVARHKET